MNRYLVLLVVSILSTTFAKDQKPFKHQEKVSATLEDYISIVDKKDIKGMLEYLTIPLDLHFGSDRVLTIGSEQEFMTIFNEWKNSAKANFHSTKVRSIHIEQTGIIDNMLAVADVTYDRLDENGNTIRTERALYHLVKGTGFYAKPLKFLWAFSTRWARKWKIYMISNIALGK